MGRLGSLGIKVPPFLMAVSLLFSPVSHLERKEERYPSFQGPPMHFLPLVAASKDSKAALWTHLLLLLPQQLCFMKSC